MTLTSRLLALLLLLILIQPASSVDAARTRVSAGPADPPGERPAAQAVIGYVYTLQAGDTLWDIAASHRITIEALLAANTVANPNLLRPGDQVFVPAAAVTMARKPVAPHRHRRNPPQRHRPPRRRRPSRPKPRPARRRPNRPNGPHSSSN